MDRLDLEARLRAEAPKQADVAIAAMRDAVAIYTRPPKAADRKVGTSRFGGDPDVPADFVWPTLTDGRVCFVGQLRLDEVSDARLPQSGLLSFFQGYLTNGEYGVEARVYYFPNTKVLVHRAMPEDFGRWARAKVGAVSFEKCVLLPPHSSRYLPWDAQYAQLWTSLHEDGSQHGMFGFDRPDEGEGGQGEDEELLLRLDAGDPLVGYDHQESVVAYYFIRREELARGDFARVRLHEGASH